MNKAVVTEDYSYYLIHWQKINGVINKTPMQLDPVIKVSQFLDMIWHVYTYTKEF